MRCAPERLAALAGANFCSGDRRQRRNDTDAEHHRRLKEIEAERAGSERARRQPAEHDKVSRCHRVDCDIGESDRPAERKRRAELALERAIGGRHSDGLRRGGHYRPGARRKTAADRGDGASAQMRSKFDKIYRISSICDRRTRMGETGMALKEIIVETQASLRADAANARAVFSVDSQQVENLRTEAKIRQFSLTVDEPPTLGGSDAGPNPVELVLAALATCQEITYRAYATALGVPLESVSVKLDGVLDLRGFFAVDERVRAGFTGVQGTVTLKSSATLEELAKLKEMVDAHCPVLDILRG